MLTIWDLVALEMVKFTLSPLACRFTWNMNGGLEHKHLRAKNSQSSQAVFAGSLRLTTGCLVTVWSYNKPTKSHLGSSSGIPLAAQTPHLPPPRPHHGHMTGFQCMATSSLLQPVQHSSAMWPWFTMFLCWFLAFLFGFQQKNPLKIHWFTKRP